MKRIFVIAGFALTSAPLLAQPSRKPEVLATPAPHEYSRLVLQARRANSYEAELVVPMLRARSAAAQKMNNTLRKWAQNDLKDFVHQAREEGAGSSKSIPAYNLFTTPDRVFITPRLVSVSIDRYFFTGGAHGMTNRFVWRLGTVNGTLRALNLGDFFSGGNFFSGGDYQQRVNDTVMKKLRADPNADWVKPDSALPVYKLTTAQLNDFAVESDGLCWTFDPYEMGSYAAGTIEIKLSANELGSQFRREMLRN